MGRGMKGTPFHGMELLKFREIAAMHFEKFCAESGAKARRSVGEFQAKEIKEHLARKGVSVGMQTIGGKPHQCIAETDTTAVQEILPIDDSGDRAGQIVFPRSVEAGHLCRLSPDKGAPRGFAGVGESRDDLSQDMRI